MIGVRVDLFGLSSVRQAERSEYNFSLTHRTHLVKKTHLMPNQHIRGAIRPTITPLKPNGDINPADYSRPAPQSRRRYL